MEAHDCNFHDGLRRCINDRCLLHRALRLLAANLAAAAAPCEAFRQGGEWKACLLYGPGRLSIKQTCADCGRSGDHGLVLWTQSVAIGKRWAHWQVCSKCFKRRTVDA